MFIERLWELNGLKLRIAEGPKHGPPLILLHGVVRQWTDFAPLWPALATREKGEALLGAFSRGGLALVRRMAAWDGKSWDAPEVRP